MGSSFRGINEDTVGGQFLGGHGDHNQEPADGVLDIEMLTQGGKGVLDK